MIVVILQARFSSSRLSGKVLKSILDKSMLSLEIERTLRSRLINKLVVATSVDSSDTEICNLCDSLSIDYYRGDLDNVLDRYYQTAKLYAPDHVVRLTGDCPLIDPEIIDKVIAYHLQGNFDYTSNINPPTFPDGLDVEIMKFSVLQDAWKKAILPSEKEHVTPYIRKTSNGFNLGNFEHNKNLSYLRWTVDEKQDFEFVSEVYSALYHNNPNFNMYDILKLMDKHPGLIQLNSNYERNEGLKKSLLKDKEISDSAKK